MNYTVNSKSYKKIFDTINIFIPNKKALLFYPGSYDHTIKSIPRK